VGPARASACPTRYIGGSGYPPAGRATAGSQRATAKSSKRLPIVTARLRVPAKPAFLVDGRLRGRSTPNAQACRLAIRRPLGGRLSRAQRAGTPTRRCKRVGHAVCAAGPTTATLLSLMPPAVA